MNTGSALARFTITLSQAVTEPVQVDWFTSDGTAKAGVDYAANKGTVLFAPGETAKTVDILVYGRAVGAEDRSFFVEMLPPTNAILGASIGECIITVDTSGSTPVTQIIVPTGPQGIQGKSAYQSYLDTTTDNPPMTEDEWVESLKGDPAEIAQEVAPLIDVGATVLTAEGTEGLSKPDQTTVKAVARRVAYASAAKIATVMLSDGDNSVGQSDLAGDVIDISSPGIVPRILRSGSFIEPQWSIQTDNKYLIKSAVAGDVLYLCQYDYSSHKKMNTNDREQWRRTLADAGITLVAGSFEEGATVNSAKEAVWHIAGAQCYTWGGALQKTVPENSSPVSTGGITSGAWSSVSGISLKTAITSGDGESLVGGLLYTGIRAYAGGADEIKCIGRSSKRDGGEGWFVLDTADTTTTDDDGTVLVGADGRRWKRAYDGAKMAAWFGVKDGTNSSAAMQAALSVGCGEIFVKDGQYNILTKVSVDHTGATYPVIGRKSSRFDLVGSSMANTVFNTNGNDFLEYTGTDGSVAGQGVHSGMKIKDFTVYGAGNAGAGLRIKGAAYLKVEDLYLVRLNAGLILTGVLSSDIKRINAQNNNYGMYINTGLNSTFNAMRISGMFGGNATCGIEGEVGTNVYIEDSNFEGNGTPGLANSGAIYLRVKEPLSTINISAYFEANAGQADLLIDNLTSSPLVVNVRGSVFNRGGGAGGAHPGQGCISNIECKSTGGGLIILNLDGNVFFTQTANGYVPSLSKPYIKPAPYLIVNGEDSCYFSENISRAETGNRGFALGLSMKADGSCSNKPQYITATRVSAGVYTINHSQQYAPDIDHFQVVAISKTSGFRVSYAQKVNLQSIRVVITDTAGNPADSDFDIIVTSRR